MMLRIALFNLALLAVFAVDSSKVMTVEKAKMGKAKQEPDEDSAVESSESDSSSEPEPIEAAEEPADAEPANAEPEAESGAELAEEPANAETEASTESTPAAAPQEPEKTELQKAEEAALKMPTTPEDLAARKKGHCILGFLCWEDEDEFAQRQEDNQNRKDLGATHMNSNVSGLNLLT